MLFVQLLLYENLPFNRLTTLVYTLLQIENEQITPPHHFLKLFGSFRMINYLKVGKDEVGGRWKAKPHAQLTYLFP